MLTQGKLKFLSFSVPKREISVASACKSSRLKFGVDCKTVFPLVKRSQYFDQTTLLKSALEIGG